MTYRDDIRTGRLRKEDETFINEADELVRGKNAFNEQRVALRYPQLTLNAGIPISERRDYDGNSQNGGDVTQVNGEYRIRATSTAGSVGSLISRQRANYISGGEIEGGIGLRLPQTPTGTGHIDWGFIDYDRNNALNFSLKSDGIYLQLTTGGSTDVDVKQDQWNIDKLDGNGPSGATLDVSDGYVYQLPFVYYGYGDIIFQVMVVVSGKKRIVPVHRVSRDGSISVEQPNLPITVEVFSDGEQLDAYVGGRQISSSLPDTSVARTVGARRAQQTVGTSWTPLISFRHKTGYESIFLTLTQLNVLSNEDLFLEIQRNATLGATSDFDPSGSGFIGNYEESERATWWDVSAIQSEFTSGQTMWEGLATGGQGNRTSATNTDVPQRPISEFDTITLAARGVSASATVTSVFKISEQW